MPATCSAATPSRCPRCGAAFTCGAAQPGCACESVALSAAQRADLARRYTGCLCLRCLREWSADSAPPTATPR